MSSLDRPMVSELARQGSIPRVGRATANRGGLQNKEIARQLKIAEQTVRNHLSNFYGKLGAKKRT